MEWRLAAVCDPQVMWEGLSSDSPLYADLVDEAGPCGGREERAGAVRRAFACWGGGYVVDLYLPKYSGHQGEAKSDMTRAQNGLVSSGDPI